MTVVQIGNARGRIALYLDGEEALALASKFRSDDLAVAELEEAVARAYPETLPCPVVIPGSGPCEGRNDGHDVHVRGAVRWNGETS